MAQYLRPVSDTNSNWSCSTGTARYALIDEVTASDTDYIYGPNVEQLVKLSTGADPGTDTGLQIIARVKGASSSNTMKVRLYQEGTLIVTISSITLTTSYVTKTWTISDANAADITDFSKLYLSFAADGAYTTYVSQAYMEIPDVPIKNGLEMGCSF